MTSPPAAATWVRATRPRSTCATTLMPCSRCCPTRSRASRCTPSPGSSARSFPLEFAMQVAGGDPVRHVVHLDVYQPDGNRNYSLSRNYVFAAGRWTGAIPLALNDPPGQWTIRPRGLLGADRGSQGTGAEMKTESGESGSESEESERRGFAGTPAPFTLEYVAALSGFCCCRRRPGLRPPFSRPAARACPPTAAARRSSGRRRTSRSPRRPTRCVWRSNLSSTASPTASRWPWLRCTCTP